MPGEETTSPERASESSSLPSRTAISPALKDATATDTIELLGDFGFVESPPPETSPGFHPARYTYNPGPELGVQRARALPNIRPDSRPSRPYNPVPERGLQPRRAVPDVVSEPRPTPSPYRPFAHSATKRRIHVSELGPRPIVPPQPDNYNPSKERAIQSPRMLPNTTPESRPTYPSNLRYPDSYRPAIDWGYQGERRLPNTLSEPRPSREAYRASSGWLGSAHQEPRTLPDTIPDARPNPSYRPSEHLGVQRARGLPNITPEPRPSRLILPSGHYNLSSYSQWAEQVRMYQERARQSHYMNEQEMDDAMRHPQQNGKTTESSGSGTPGSSFEGSE
jgi:hypothetical protein